MELIQKTIKQDMGQIIQKWTKYILWKAIFKKFTQSTLECFVLYLTGSVTRLSISRSSHSQMYLKYMFLKISQYSQETPALEFLFNKVSA